MIKTRIYRPGFTLLELAILLMVVGSVTGVIWVAGQHVLDNYRLYRANQQIALTVQNIRNYYGTTIQTWGTPGPGFTAGNDITATLDQLLPNIQIFPSEMRRDPTQAPGKTVMDHAINNYHGGGSFHIYAVTNAASTAKPQSFDAFRVELQGLSMAACTNLLMSAPITSDVIGMVSVATDKSVPATIIKGVSATANVAPMILSTATTWCTGATLVDFDFALHN